MIGNIINPELKQNAYNKLSGIKSSKEIDSWVLQFRPEHQSYAYKLLSYYSYINSEDLHNDCRVLYSRLISYDLTNPCYVGFGPFGKSGPSIGYYFRLANVDYVLVDNCIAFEEIATSDLSNFDSIVLIDDFVGSGNQAISFWVETISLIAKFNKNIRIIYLALAGFKEGKNNIESKTPISVEILHQLTEFDKAFSPTYVFSDYYEANKVASIFENYGKKLEPKYPLGYGGNQALISFFYNTPNNTLPIFWSTKKGWTPLFPRHEPKKSEKKKTDEIKATILEEFDSGNFKLDPKEVEVCFEYVNYKEALFDWELPTTTLIFDYLFEKGRISKFQIKGKTIFSTHRVAINAAVSCGINKIEEISRFSGLSAKKISEITNETETWSWKDGFLTRESLPVELIIFDWSNTLVDEYVLDDAICEFIPFPDDNNKEVYLKNIIEFRELLSDLERDNSHLWYDYIFLGKKFGKTEDELRKVHFQNIDKIKELLHINEELRQLKDDGLKLAIATNCIKPVLEWRAEMLNVDLSIFDIIITSDLITNVGDKREYIDYALQNLNISGENTVMVSDNFDKDLLPAKMLNLKTIWTKYYRKRARSYWGTPALPVDRVAYEFSRKHVKTNVVDILLTDVSLIRNIIRKK